MLSRNVITVLLFLIVETNTESSIRIEEIMPERADYVGFGLKLSFLLVCMIHLQHSH